MCARPTLPRLADHQFLWSSRFQPATPASELGGRVGDEDRDPVGGHEGVGVVGVERCGARHDRADAREVGRIDVSLQHHAQRGRHQADRRRTVPADRIGPTLHREAIEEAERSAVADALQDAEEPTQMHQRRVHDGDTAPEAHRLVPVRLVVLGPDEYTLEHPVAQIDTLGWAGGAAGEHAHGHAGPSRARVGQVPRFDCKRSGHVRHAGSSWRARCRERGRPRRPVRRRTRRGPALRCPARVRSRPRPGLMVTTHPPARSTPRRSPTDAGRLRRRIPTSAPGARTERGRLLDRVGQVAPGGPGTLELDRRGVGVDGQDVGDPDARAAVVGTVVIGRAAPAGAGGCSATSAMPIGLPSRV